MSVYPVIMCGGSGTRLWPASRPARPKQFMALIDDQSSFEQTVERVAQIDEVAGITIVTGAAHVGWVTRQLAACSLPAEILLEPEARDSAAAIAAAAAWIYAKDPDGVVVVVAADHHVPDARAFAASAGIAVAAAREGRIVTLGVKPTRPSSAYGYIQPEGQADVGRVAPVAAFVEKPDASTAQTYIEQGFLWNSGNFIAPAAVLLSELDRFAAEVADAARRAVDTGVRLPGRLRLGEAFRSAPKISIDYAVMEKTDRASVAPVDFAWSDLGAWDAVREASPQTDGLAITGEALTVESSNLLIRTTPGVVVAAAGVRDLAIVVEDDAVLVCGLDRAQSVKDITNQLKAGGYGQIDAPGAGPVDLDSETDRLRQWLFTAALPIWASLGVDEAGWGMHELVGLGGVPQACPRRARVQVRQAYSYAIAGRLGWPGAWRAVVARALDDFEAPYRRGDGFFRTLVSAEGEVLDDTVMLYDQAFWLLALSAAGDVRPTALADANATLDLIEARMRHPAGGFRENGDQPFQSNPHMHLFEAAIAWSEAGGGTRWEALAAEIAEFALNRFIDPASGALREFFTADWDPAPGDAGDRVEPGHQFEWAWLLERWARRTGDQAAANAARRLYDVGVMGVDPAREAAVDAINADNSMRSPRARLWPQTERLKAALMLSERAEGDAAAAYRRDAGAALKTLRRYLDAPIVGLWYDKLMPDDTLVEEPASASTFYHIVTAVQQLLATQAHRRGASAALPQSAVGEVI